MMDDDFNLSDFDAPTETPDHRILLDTIRAEASAGVREMVSPIVTAQKELHATVGVLSKEVRAIAQAQTALKQASHALAWDRIFQLITVALALAGILAGAGIGWQAIKPPKIEAHYYGCNGRLTNDGQCQGTWRLLQKQKVPTVNG